MPRPRGRVLFRFLLLCAILCLGSPSRADSLEEAARALARQITFLPAAHGPVRLVWQNASALAAAQSEELRRAFVAEIAERRARLTEEAGAPELRVSLREIPANFLLIADISGAAGPADVRMVQVPRAAVSVAEHASLFLSLQKELLWRQREALLDAAELPGEAGRPALLLLLGRESLSLFRAEKGGWVLQDTAPFSPPVPLSRDLRGEIRLEGQRAQVLLPGRLCEADLERKIFVNCRVGSETWRERAALSSACDAGSWQLATGAGDWSVPDQIRLESAHGKDAGASGASPLDLPGPVLSLSAGVEQRAAWAVVWNLTSGNYEVYRITLACGN